MIYLLADWKILHAGAPSGCIQHIHLFRNGAEFLHKGAPKVVGIPISLHSNEIEIHDRAQKICAPGSVASTSGAGQGI